MRIWNRLFSRPQRKSVQIEQQEELSEFDVELRGLFKSMLDIAFEYVNFNDKEVTEIYVFCSTEISLYFTFFYRIHETVLDRHLINEKLHKKCDISSDKQFEADDFGLIDLNKFVALFKSAGREVPTIIKLSFSVVNQKFDTNLSYDHLLANSELMATDLSDQWLEDLSRIN